MDSAIKYREWLIEKLKDRHEAEAYLNAAFDEYLKGDEESKQILKQALKNVQEAQDLEIKD
jgi:uncharacterized protein YbaP (TraB family)